MENKLMEFSFDDCKVRVVERGGEPWFVAADVCSFFGVANGRSVVARLDEDEKGVCNVDTLGGRQKMSVVNEGGLYHMLFTMDPNMVRRGASKTDISERAEALKRFKRWVTHDVIPSIRKHGAYMTTEAIERAINDPAFTIGLLTALQDERNARVAAEDKLALAAPKVEFAEQVVASSGTLSIGDFAKIVSGSNGVNYGRNRLFAELRDHKILNTNNVPYQQFITAGYFTVIETLRYGVPYSVTRITGVGQEWLTAKLIEWNKQDAEAAD